MMTANQCVSFYLGFTIRGPVAFSIQTKPNKKGRKVIRTNNIKQVIVIMI